MSYPQPENAYAAGFAAGCQFAIALLTVVPRRGPKRAIVVMLDAVRAGLAGRAAAEWQRAGADPERR